MRNEVLMNERVAIREVGRLAKRGTCFWSFGATGTFACSEYGFRQGTACLRRRASAVQQRRVLCSAAL